jgi:ribosomal protein S18 acetylase RimI-like enzyme
MPPDALPPGITLRPTGEGDLPFLRALYGSTRRRELDLIGWGPEQRNAFVAMQFEAQSRHYREHHPEADFEVIELDGEPIGRLTVESRPDELHLIDIALVPERRNRGLGGALVRRLLRRAERSGVALRIHVGRDNPAHRLYRRLGFRTLEEQGPYTLMEWRAPTLDGVGG